MSDTDKDKHGFHNTFFHKRMKSLRSSFPQRERDRVPAEGERDIYKDGDSVLRECKGERGSGEEEEMDIDRKRAREMQLFS